MPPLRTGPRTNCKRAHGGATVIHGRSNELLGVRCFRTWPLHCNLRLNEPNSLVECFGTSIGPENPGHIGIFTHNCAHQRSAYALATMSISDDEERQVAVGQIVSYGAYEAKESFFVDSYEYALRFGDELPKCFRVLEPRGPARFLCQ
jgi:hypothetical protein